MSELETKRNSIMNAIASGQLTNLLANKTWSKGYFTNSGTIGTQTGNKEAYEEEYIEIDVTKTYLLIMERQTSNSLWSRSVFYKSDYSNNGTVLLSANNTTDVFCGTVIPPSSSAYMRVSLRAWSGTDIALVDMDEVQQWLDSKITYETVSGE